MTSRIGTRLYRRRWIVAALVAVTALSGCTSDTDPVGNDATTPVTIPDGIAGCESFAADGNAAPGGQGLPALQLPCLVSGDVVALDDLGERPVLVNLWASWCAPCREEMPLLQAAFERDGDRIGYLGIITEDTPSAAASLLDDLDVTYGHVVDRDRRLLTELAAPGLPVTLAVAADGRILDRHMGPMSADRLDELVSLLSADGAGTP
jgi:cytochrome c biogenesis protein CcmG, thiol:disulfide interchange protein DsbE